MAAKSAANTSSSSSSGWSKWQIAVVFGTPVVIGVGVWLYKNRSNKKFVEKSERVDSKSAKSKQQQANNSSASSSQHSEDKIAANDFGSLEEKAEAAKIKGNQYFKEGKYEEAIKCYTEAIALCPTDKLQSISTFYQNRAAASEKLKDYAAVISDCTQALELNSKYTKALNRRAKAFEHQQEYDKAIQDATALCILEQFQSQSSLILADRILKEVGQQHAKEAIKKPRVTTPSKYFIKQYFSSFAEDPILNFKNVSQLSLPDGCASGFVKAHTNIVNGNYDNIINECTKDAEDPNSPYHAEALLLRATFYILRGQPEPAFQDMDKLLHTDGISDAIKVNALIKLASLKVQYEKVEEAFEHFEAAEKINPNNTDIFHHRGQIYLLLEKMEDAVKDFEKAIELNANFSVAAAQKCYADYRYAHFKRDHALMEKSMTAFKETIEKFPHCVECYSLYAQALVDQQNFEKAEKYYNLALKEDPNNANVYVHKGLLLLHWRQDFQEAINLMKLAIEKDDRCEFAYETLGALQVQRGDLDNSLELFDKAISLARTEPELAHLYSLREAAATQQLVTKRLGISLQQFENM